MAAVRFGSAHVGAVDELTPNDVHDELQGVDPAMKDGVNTTDSKAGPY
jgi:hypothetical protein